jgi:3'(2'), 5'-bisphosphate nucleotidase
VRSLAGGAPQRINVSGTADPAQARFCESVESGHSSHDHSAQVAELLGITKPGARLDSQAKYGVVARGEADIYLRLPTKADYFEKIWDHAGGVLVVEEAGGKATDVGGRALDFKLGRELRANRGVVVTNGKLHERVLGALREVGVK